MVPAPLQHFAPEVSQPIPAAEPIVFREEPALEPAQSVVLRQEPAVETARPVEVYAERAVEPPQPVTYREEVVVEAPQPVAPAPGPGVAKFEPIVLSMADLQQVETDPNRARVAQAAVAEAPAPRPRRVRPALPAVSDEPLQQVETQK
jgi:ribonuclease E